VADAIKAVRQELGTEVWAHGSFEDLQVLRGHLNAIGVDVAQTEQVPIARGRYRWYARIHLRTASGA
jgi:hypothetical protein